MVTKQNSLFDIDINENWINQNYPEILKKLLFDHTTKKNIIWATNDYSSKGIEYKKEAEITVNSITGKNGGLIHPRALKNKKIQLIRRRDNAEVFTPSWVCNLQNNIIDEAWFEKKNVFNTTKDEKWIKNKEKINFNNKTWKDYVNDIRLEVCCGEAPYLVSRYDNISGKKISINNRIGILDRKIRVINENVKDEKQWFEWIIKAYKSIYGYEFQGDNLLLARENCLFSFADYVFDRFNRKPEEKELQILADIINWNIWQMDGINMSVPYLKEIKKVEQLSFLKEVEKEKGEQFSFLNNYKEEGKPIPCYIYDWEAEKCIKFKTLLRKYE